MVLKGGANLLFMLGQNAQLSCATLLRFRCLKFSAHVQLKCVEALCLWLLEARFVRLCPIKTLKSDLTLMPVDGEGNAGGLGQLEPSCGYRITPGLRHPVFGEKNPPQSPEPNTQSQANAQAAIEKVGND